MLTRMRTTLVIDDHVFAEAKRRALETGLTLSELTTMALRDTLRKANQPPHTGAFSMPTFGSDTRRTSSPSEIAEFRDDGR